MELLRTLTKWISKHKTISTIFSVFFFAALLFTRVVINRMQGTLSDPVKRGVLTDAVYGIGTVTATRSFSIKPGTTSTITDLYVKEGDNIKKGGLLAKIDSVVYRAPFDGVVNYLPFKVGENIFTQLPVMVFTDLGNRYIVVSLEQQGALRVRAGQKAQLSFDSIRDKTFEGSVQSVYSYNSNFLARIDVSALPSEILPDMTADIGIVIRQVQDAILIPASAYEDGAVWVKRGHSLPSRVEVKLGIVDGTKAEVISGDVHEGDTLVIRRKVGP